MAEDPKIGRREFLTAAGAAAAVLAPAQLAEAQQAQPVTPSATAPVAAPAAPPADEPLLTLTATEHAFFAAAADTIIPADNLSPSGSDCGVANFIDRQLAGAYGTGARLYRQGPFPKGKPEQGYQLSLNPREFFRAGIASANEFTRKSWAKDFDRLNEEQRIAALQAMEAGKAEFKGFGSAMFFNALLQITMEGFFADPMYGGNRDMAAWKMVGYPGLPATYRHDIKKYLGKVYDKPPRSIADFS
ncbi:gluconate 2-dehydrogenase subunit 3 family protein [Bradyrhizobium erythrophlei]|jgi:gluconate 2-dehydrogenase gamma chain|uniref:Gluconate 2-dehydrogenase gamma chain n=1 Tax=Bradyrhizobium erythrophlei TaxID=1437360 RepID=A0A1M7UF69_9BRAD|nr:gluconate 2-dehydrogenase subunit 3 family protein [Bradyrhizobium erythrophlei]SHN81669.1 gluconate 2-dehydrogenase gamma chain [Bradyrhizobium erythrophlei]